MVMIIRPGKRLSRSASLVFTFVLATLAIQAGAANGPMRAKRLVSNANQKLHLTPLRNATREIEVFVRLDEPAVAELNAQSMEATGQFATPDAQKSQAARVSAQQNAFKPTLQSMGARILAAQRVGANGFRVLVRPAEISSLRTMPGVRSVGRVEKHKLDLVDSVPWIGAPAVWNTVGKGKGVKVGIIDTGIDYTHAAFGGPGTPADYTANNPSVVEPGSFPLPGNAVRGGIDLAGADYNADDPTTSPVPDNDPLDGNGHGTHVAATAAGRGVPGSVGVGVAPEASLYAIKVFGDHGRRNRMGHGSEWRRRYERSHGRDQHESRLAVRLSGRSVRDLGGQCREIGHRGRRVGGQ
jgi:minor extracellular serine protease Vpr